MNILGNGYVRLIESWGSEEQVISSARMSTNGAFKGWGPHQKCFNCDCKWRNNNDGTISLWDSNSKPCKDCDNEPFLGGYSAFPGDEKLLKYLWDHKHHTPFEMAGMTVEIQAPLFVFRQIQRHRSFSYNEFSGRYAVMEDIYYVPDASRVRKQDPLNKQSTGLEALPQEVVKDFLIEIAAQQKLIQESYERFVSQGIPKELARINMPLSKMSRMRMSGNLRNWLGFLRLRLPGDVQEETRIVAETCFDLIKPIFPRTSQFFIEETTKDS